MLLHRKGISGKSSSVPRGYQFLIATVTNSQRLGRLEQKVLLAVVEADKSELKLWEDFFHRC